MKVKMITTVVIGIIILVIVGVYHTHKERVLDNREIKIYNNMMINLTMDYNGVKNGSSISNKDAINKMYSSIYEAKGNLETAEIFDGNNNHSFAQLRILWRDLQTYQSTIEFDEKGKQFLMKQISVVLRKLPKRVDNINMLPASVFEIEDQLDANYTSYKMSLNL